jgi:hypothetical protein
VASSSWRVADRRYTSEAESAREHTVFASLSSETDSSCRFLGRARTGGTRGYNRDTNRRRQGMDPDGPARPSMGRITEAFAQQFTIHPEGHALETMAGIEPGPFVSLNAALAAIEKHTRGVCRYHPAEDQP